MFGSRCVLVLASLLINAAAVLACEAETRPPATDLEGEDGPGAAGLQPAISPVASPSEQPALSTPSGVGSQAPAAPDTGSDPVSTDATTGTNGTTTGTTSDAVTTANTGNTLTSDTAGVTGAGGVDVTSNGGAEETPSSAAVDVFDGGVLDAGMVTEVSGL
jgi:hypothetical protein